MIRKAKKDFEERMASNIKGNFKKASLNMLEAGNLPEKRLALWMVREVKGR